MLSVVYRSAATPGLADSDVEQLLAAARAKNRREGVTGMLLAENGRFLQALEGPEVVVRGLLTAIEADPRHEHMRILTHETVPARRFGDWAMAHGHIGEMESMPLAQYVEALMDARDELPVPPTRLQRAMGFLRPRPRTLADVD